MKLSRACLISLCLEPRPLLLPRQDRDKALPLSSLETSCPWPTMKFTLSWLKDHLQTDASLDEIAAKLTLIGLEVEGIEDPAAKLKDFTIARVLEAEPHPNADKLRVCKVETGSGIVQVVCGAPNARKGLIGVFAAPGTHVPGLKVTLGKATIRGVDSAGMLCSERELELSTEHSGIIELPERMKKHIGERFADAMQLSDPVIDIAITPNRPDCLGVRGVARDLAAAGLGTLKKVSDGYEGKGEFDSPIRIELPFPKGAENACPIFVGRYIRGATNKASPEWMQRRLRAVGLRPINAAADVTNYISYDRARPLHVYDADKLQGPIMARLGKKGESFLALDGKTYEVDETMCVIADQAQVLGLGGIMGGEATGCTEATTNIFIESAYFDPGADRCHRAQDRHQLGLALSLRARHRPAIRDDGPQPRDANDPGILRGRAERRRCGRERTGGGAGHRFRPGARAKAFRREILKRRDRVHAEEARLYG